MTEFQPVSVVPCSCKQTMSVSRVRILVCRVWLVAPSVPTPCWTLAIMIRANAAVSGDEYVYPLLSVPFCESVLVTTTFTVPAACAGVVAVIEVALTTVTLVAAVPPKLTVAPDAKPLPVIATDVPPLVLPEVGEIAVTVGADVLYVNPLLSVPLCESVLVTTTLTVPAACAAVVAVIEVELTTVTLVAAVPPKLTVAPDEKPVPVIVTDVPPLVLPEVGEIEVTVGAGALLVAASKLSKMTLPGAFACTTEVPPLTSKMIAEVEIEVFQVSVYRCTQALGTPPLPGAVSRVTLPVVAS